jgi:hypothetical protein
MWTSSHATQSVCGAAAAAAAAPRHPKPQPAAAAAAIARPTSPHRVRPHRYVWAVLCLDGMDRRRTLWVSQLTERRFGGKTSELQSFHVRTSQTSPRHCANCPCLAPCA